MTGDYRAKTKKNWLSSCPGVAFDLSGNRLGRGKGWYDRLIEKLGQATFVALAYDFQIVDASAG